MNDLRNDMEQSLEQSVARLADSVLQLANAMQFIELLCMPIGTSQPAHEKDTMAKKEDVQI